MPSCKTHSYHSPRQVASHHPILLCLHAEAQSVLSALMLSLPLVPETIPLSLAAGDSSFPRVPSRPFTRVRGKSLHLPGTYPYTQHSSWQSPASRPAHSITFDTNQRATHVGSASNLYIPLDYLSSLVVTL